MPSVLCAMAPDPAQPISYMTFLRSLDGELYTLEQHTANPASRHPLLNDVAGCTAAYRILFDGLHTIDLGYVAGCVAAHCVAWSIVVVLGKTSLQILSLLKSTWMVFVH